MGVAPYHEEVWQQRRRGGSGRPALIGVVGVLVALLATVGVVANQHSVGRVGGAAPDGSVRARVVPPPDADASIEAEVHALLDRRAQAVLHRDRSAFLATVDPDRPAFRASQVAMFDALADVPLASWSYELDATVPAAVPAGAQAGDEAPTWAPAVSLRYAVQGFDATPAVENQGLTFVHRPTGWLVGSDSDFDGTARRTVRDPWDFGPVSVTQGVRTLVLGHPAAASTMRAVAAEADADIPAVTRVWGPWAERVVVIVPADQEELARITGKTGDLSAIAAVAVAVDGRPNGESERIVVNPANFARLPSPGRRVVLTHELTHVAAGPATGPAVPTWLAEGLADYVAYRDVDVASVARELAADVRAGRRPAALPTDADFDGASAALPQQYEMSWLACRLIVQRTDSSTLLRFYRAVGASRDAGSAAAAVATAMRAELSTTVESFTAAWQAYLTAELA